MAAFRAQLLGPRKGVERRRLMFALLMSLLAHALLMRMTFDGQGLGLPRFSFSWQERRVAVPELQVTLVPAAAPVAAPASAPVAARPEDATLPRIDSGSTPPRPSVSRSRVEGAARVALAPKPAPAPGQQDAAAVTATAPEGTPKRAEPRGAAAFPPPIPALPVIAVEQAVLDTWVVPAEPESAPIVAAAPSIGDTTRLQVEPEASEGVPEPVKPDSAVPEEQGKAEQLEAARREEAA